MWNDNETIFDLIDFQQYISAVFQIADDGDLLPSTIGIFGDWGSGKSSLMKMIAQNYEGDPDTLVIKFNGWLFEGYEDAKSVLMATIVDEIIGKRTLSEKLIKISARLLKRIDLMKLGGTAIKYGLTLATAGPAGLGILSLTDALNKLKDVDYEKYVKDKNAKTEDKDDSLRNDIQEFHKNFEELVNETKVKKIVVFIDDLDRCSPDTIIGTLEAIKLFLFVPKTVFVIGADERLIKYAVRKRFPEMPGDRVEVGRDYLEKLIQHPIRIPPLNSHELETYINLLFSYTFLDAQDAEELRRKVLNEKIKDVRFTLDGSNMSHLHRKKIGDDLKEALLLSAQITPVLAIGLNGNPRQVKRFLNMLLIRQQMAQSRNIELKKRVLAKMMLLEYFKPEIFKSFYEVQARDGGVIKEIGELEQLANGNFESKSEKGGKKVGETKSLTGLEIYLQDTWMTDWLKTEPSLRNVNLQPYYYFSRDTFSQSTTHLLRMSPAAQEVYKKLISDSDSIKTAGMNESKVLNQADAAAIFDSLTDKIKQEESLVGEKSTLRRLIEFCGVHQELISQLILFIDKIPDTLLPISIMPLLEGLVKSGPHESGVQRLIAKWSESTDNPTLAKVAKRKLAK